MTTKQFNAIINDQLEHCCVTLRNKAAEYATEDRLHNFKVAAALGGVTPQLALAGMMAKHTVSIYDMCRGGEGVIMERRIVHILLWVCRICSVVALASATAHVVMWQPVTFTPVTALIWALWLTFIAWKSKVSYNEQDNGCEHDLSLYRYKNDSPHRFVLVCSKCGRRKKIWM